MRYGATISRGVCSECNFIPSDPSRRPSADDTEDRLGTPIDAVAALRSTIEVARRRKMRSACVYRQQSSPSAPLSLPAGGAVEATTKLGTEPPRDSVPAATCQPDPDGATVANLEAAAPELARVAKLPTPMRVSLHARRRPPGRGGVGFGLGGTTAFADCDVFENNAGRHSPCGGSRGHAFGGSDLISRSVAHLYALSPVKLRRSAETDASCWQLSSVSPGMSSRAARPRSRACLRERARPPALGDGVHERARSADRVLII